MAGKFFTYFPKIVVDGYSIRNFTLKVEIVESIKNDPNFFQVYQIKNGETPESLAQDFYEDPNLCWILLMANDIVDVYSQWPMNDIELERYMTEKYGEGNLYDVHHYETADNHFLGEGVVVERDYAPFEELNEITNYQYEEDLNDRKRLLKVVKRDLVDAIVSDLAIKMLSVEEDVPENQTIVSGRTTPIFTTV